MNIFFLPLVFFVFFASIGIGFWILKPLLGWKKLSAFKWWGSVQVFAFLLLVSLYFVLPVQHLGLWWQNKSDEFKSTERFLQNPSQWDWAELDNPMRFVQVLKSRMQRENVLDDQAWLSLAQVYWAVGRLDDASAALRKAYAFSKTPNDILKLQVRLYWQKSGGESSPELSVLLKKGLKQAPNDLELLTVQATLWQKSGDINRAREAFSKVLSLMADKQGPDADILRQTILQTIQQ
jgi:cytochrome c-type biogenesis protein CcmH/NrfG